ncbi:MAG: energy transducer TonB, partial [Desulfobulbaceae bacterium]|nr:energy transducer TonB [Desulfobulbaceae bacterium]
IHFTGIYKIESIKYIEITMCKPAQSNRIIPPPPKPLPKIIEPEKISKMDIKPPQPELKEIDPLKPIEPIRQVLPPTPPPVKVAQWEPPAPPAELIDQYFGTVRYQIEKHKQYPSTAQKRNIQGEVTVRFVITPDGGIRNLVLVKSSNHKALDDAALKAVSKASPFPKPPANLVTKKEMILEISILFDLA